MNIRISKLLFGVIFSILIISNFSYAKARWVKVGDNWRYEGHAGGGDYVTERWRAISDNGVDEKVYYFDYYGNMVTGPVLINAELYIYGDDGAAVTTGFDYDGIHYETDGKGKVKGLPPNFDYSAFKSVATPFTASMNLRESQKTVYDDNNSIMPTAGKD